jgi:hypothetical protein
MSFHPYSLGVLTRLGDIQYRLPPRNAFECVSCVKMCKVKYIPYLDSYMKFFRVCYVFS